MPRLGRANIYPRRNDSFYYFFLVCTAFLAGAMIMVLEVIGSRVIGPYFGASLFVWTSLISVTMLALAVGYAVGGWLIDRYETADVLYLTVGLAGLAVLLIPLIKLPVIQWCIPLGLRGGSFVSTTLLFGPSLLLLGCVSPQLARVATRNLSQLGRVVGGLYALSTIGSVAGTLLTGFVLIAYVSVDRIFTIVAFVLLLLAAIYFVLFRRRPLALLAILLPLLLPGPRSIQQKTLASGVTVELIDAVESFYGSVKVVDYRNDRIHIRELIIDGLVQGGVDLANGLSIYEYPYFLEYLSIAAQPQGKRCLVIGLGAGLTPRRLEARGITTDVVDIDPAVVEMARQHFGFELRGDLFVDDARYFLANSQRSYDYIMLDVFSGDITPGYLLSREAIELLRLRLAPGGVLVMNLVGTSRPGARSTAAILETLRGAFDQVEAYPAWSRETARERDPDVGNLAVLAYGGEPRPLQFPNLDELAIHPLARDVVVAQLERLEPLRTDPTGLVLSDDYNPLDVMDIWIKEEVRRSILRETDWDILGSQS